MHLGMWANTSCHSMSVSYIYRYVRISPHTNDGMGRDKFHLPLVRGWMHSWWGTADCDVVNDFSVVAVVFPAINIICIHTYSSTYVCMCVFMCVLAYGGIAGVRILVASAPWLPRTRMSSIHERFRHMFCRKLNKCHFQLASHTSKETLCCALRRREAWLLCKSKTNANYALLNQLWNCLWENVCTMLGIKHATFKLLVNRLELWSVHASYIHFSNWKSF